MCPPITFNGDYRANSRPIRSLLLELHAAGEGVGGVGEGGLRADGVGVLGAGGRSSDGNFHYQLGGDGAFETDKKRETFLLNNFKMSVKKLVYPGMPISWRNAS